MRARAQKIRTERQRKALEAQQAEQRRLEEERFVFLPVFVNDFIILYHFVILTLSPPIPLNLYTLPYWSNPLFLISDI